MTGLRNRVKMTLCVRKRMRMIVSKASSHKAKKASEFTLFFGNLQPAPLALNADDHV